MSNSMKLINNSSYVGKMFFLIAVMFGYLIPQILYAAAPTDNAISQVVCNVVNQLTGPIGQAISTIAVIFIGIGLFMGKIFLGLALGIAMLFGAENIVGWIGGNTVTCTAGAVI